MKKYLRFLTIFTIAIVTAGSLFASTSHASVSDENSAIMLTEPGSNLENAVNGNMLPEPRLAGPTADFIDIGLYATSCGDFEVVLRSTAAISNTNLTNVQFTVKWPITTPNVALTNIVADASYPLITQQGSTAQSGGYNYALFAGVGFGY